MLSTTARTAARTVAKRNFSSSVAKQMHYPEGPYTNIPFKVHGRKYVPYWAVHWGFFAVGLSAPFLIVFYNLKKSG